MIDLYLSGWVPKTKNKMSIKSILLPLISCIYSYILSFTIYFVIFKFSTLIENVQFHIPQSYMKIRFSGLTNFCAQKAIKKTQYFSPGKLINLFHDIFTNLSPQSIS